MKYYIKLIFLLLLVISNISSGQIPPGAAFIGSGQSNLYYNSIWSVYSNPSALLLKGNFSSGFYYSPSPFGMNELSNYFGAIGYGFSFGTVVIGYKNYGFELYKENEFRINYSRNINRLFLGISVKLYRISIVKYGSILNYNADFGCTYKLDNISFGFSTTNLLRNRKNKLLYAPLILQTGITINPLDNFIISAAIYKEDIFPISYRVGFEYNFFNIIFLRTGFITYPGSYTAGIGIKYYHFEINYAIINHQQLGLTHQFDVNFKMD